MKYKSKILMLTANLVLFVLLSFAPSLVFAQETPLNLGEVMIGLKSQSSGLTIDQKNTFIKQRVEQRGVTFALSPVITEELKRAGASDSLIAVIGDNGPQSNQTSTANSTNKTPRIEFTKLWVEKDIEKGGRKGMIVHTSYTAYNLKDSPLQLTIRFQDSNKRTLKSTNSSYSNKSGELAAFKNFRPGHEAAVYKDWAVFVPYNEMTLNPGRHSLEIVADIVDSEGVLFKHLTLHSLTLVRPRPSLRAPKAVFEKMWVDYNVTEAGLQGMRVHAKFKTYNLKDVTCYLKIGFEKQDGTKLPTKNTLFSDRSGSLTLFSELKPSYATAVYRDVSIFMPYKELNLPKGDHKLKMRGDLIYADGGLIKHFNYYRFTFKN